MHLVMLHAAVNQFLMLTSAYPTLLYPSRFFFSISIYFHPRRDSWSFNYNILYERKTANDRNRSFEAARRRKTWVLVKLRPRLAISRNQWFGSLKAFSISGLLAFLLSGFGAVWWWLWNLGKQKNWKDHCSLATAKLEPTQKCWNSESFHISIS